MGSLKQFTTQRPLRPPDPLTTQIDLELFEMPHHSALSISPLLSLSFISSFPFLLYILLNGFVMDDDYNYSGSSGDYACGLVMILMAMLMMIIMMMMIMMMIQAQTASVVSRRGTPRLSEVRRPKSASGHGRLAWSGVAVHLSSVEQQSLAMSGF